jgi:hypothetical protein
MIKCDVEKVAGRFIKQVCLLVLDFCGHMRETVKVAVNMDSDLVVIPGGMTKLLQPLDVVINWPFKVALQWMTTMKHGLMPSGRLKCRPLLTVCELILAAWCSISPGIMEKRFKVTKNIFHLLHAPNFKDE